MTAFGAYELLPIGTRVVLGGQRRADGGVHRKCQGSALGGGEKAVRSDADGRPIRPIVRLRLDNLNGFEEVGGELCLERIEEPGSIRVAETGWFEERGSGNVLGIDADGLRAVVNIAEGERRLIVGSGMGHGGVLRIGEVFGEIHRVHGTR